MVFFLSTRSKCLKISLLFVYGSSYTEKQNNFVWQINSFKVENVKKITPTYYRSTENGLSWTRLNWAMAVPQNLKSYVLIYVKSYLLFLIRLSKTRKYILKFPKLTWFSNAY